jgi:hypothetical protein
MVSNMGLWVDNVKDEQGLARSFKSPSHLFLISQFRVREHSLFSSRWDKLTGAFRVAQELHP